MSNTSTQIRSEVRQLRLRLRPYQLDTSDGGDTELAQSEAATPDVDEANTEIVDIDQVDRSGIVSTKAEAAGSGSPAVQVAPRRSRSLIRRIISTPFGSWVELGLGIYVSLALGSAVTGVYDHFRQPRTVNDACFCQDVWHTCPPGFSMRRIGMGDFNIAECISDLNWAFNQGQDVTRRLLRAAGAGAGLALLRRVRDAGAIFPWNPLRLGLPRQPTWEEDRDPSDRVVRRAPIRRHHFNIPGVPYLLGFFALLAVVQILILFYRIVTAVPPDAPYPACEEGPDGWWVANIVGGRATCYTSQTMARNISSSVGLALLVLPIAWLAAVLLHEDNMAMKFQFLHPGDDAESADRTARTPDGCMK